MTPAIALLILGAILLRAGFKNQSVVDAAMGKDTTRGSDVPRVGGGDFTSAELNTGTGAGDLESEANRMIGLRLPYKWGGGHAGFDPDGPWDCSGAVSWLTHFLGDLDGHPLVSGQFATSWGEPGRGSYYTVYANPTHVFIKMESGPRAGQCWGTTRRIASQGGSLRWHQHTTIGFVPRRPRGDSHPASPSSPRRRLP